VTAHGSGLSGFGGHGARPRPSCYTLTSRPVGHDIASTTLSPELRRPKWITTVITTITTNVNYDTVISIM